MHIFHPEDFQPNYSVNQGWNPEAIPAIVFFPGGGFRACGQTAFYRQAVHLATRGMVAGVCSYKVESQPTQATRDAGVVQAAAAVEFMRNHAVELNIDAHRVVASGGSAGGYIAAGACFVPLGTGGPGGPGCPNLAVVRRLRRSLLSFSRPSHPSIMGSGHCPWLPVPNRRCCSQLFNPFTGARPRGDHPDHPNLPVHHITGDGPPTLILHGEEDTSVPCVSKIFFSKFNGCDRDCRQKQPKLYCRLTLPGWSRFATVETYRDLMRAADNKCELIGYPGQQHAFFHREGFYQQTVLAMDVSGCPLTYAAMDGRCMRYATKIVFVTIIVSAT
eukprot:COSAG02_NODE_2079_length_9902_cov_3.742018_2_plen_331_part_00